jgi:glycerophosphoryl diester phosphodiesterase
MIEALFALLILPVVSSSAVAEKSKLAQDIQQISGKVDIIGHRGAAGLAPENTLAAFKKACKLGMDAVELDVFLTADSTIVVHHDYTHWLAGT